MEIINSIIESYNIPLLSAFLLGVMTSISPCPLATNITAVAYISRKLNTLKHTFLNSIFYTLGRSLSYTFVAVLIYFGVSIFSLSNIFEGWGSKLLGPVLVLISLVMFGIMKINIGSHNNTIDNLKKYLSNKGYLGSMLLGVIFASAFCPYSGILFFGVLIPLIFSTGEGLILAPVFALGTGIPVIIFSFILVFSMEKLSKLFKVVQKIEKVLRYIVASVFMLSGLYYSYFLLKFLLNLL